jgi:hypothetical protein
MRQAIPLLLALLVAVQAAPAQTTAPPPQVDSVETITSEAPKTPLEKAIDGFVKSYAAPTLNVSKIPRWARGLCPGTAGLTPEQNLGVTAFVRKVAAQAGAPAAAKEPCNPNITIIFTRTPQAVMDDIVKNHEELLGYHEVGQTTRIATMRHPIQAWYATGTRDEKGFLIPDRTDRDPNCESELNDLYILPIMSPSWVALFHKVYADCGGLHETGNRMNDGMRSEILAATIVVDVGKLGDTGLKQVANYIAMLALSQTQTFETCQPLVSIVNLMTPGCEAALKPDTLSPSDLAYLSALYRVNPEVRLSSQQSGIAHQMEAALGGH